MASNLELGILLDETVSYDDVGSFKITLNKDTFTKRQLYYESLFISRGLKDDGDVSLSDPYALIRSAQITGKPNEEIAQQAIAEATKIHAVYRKLANDHALLVAVLDDLFVVDIDTMTALPVVNTREGVTIPKPAIPDDAQMNVERLKAGLYPVPTRNFANPIEQKLLYIEALIEAHPDLNTKLSSMTHGSLVGEIQKAMVRSIVPRDENGFQSTGLDSDTVTQTVTETEKE